MSNYKKEKEPTLKTSEKAPVEYILKLFVTGASPNSVRAIANLKSICQQYLVDNYSLDIIDVYQQFLEAEHYQLIALPMLIKYEPAPLRRIIGDLSDTEKVLKALGLEPKK